MRCWIERGIYSCSVAAETWSFGKASCRHGHNFCTVTRIYTTWVRFVAMTFKLHYFPGHRYFAGHRSIPRSLAFVTLFSTSLSRLDILRCRRHRVPKPLRHVAMGAFSLVLNKPTVIREDRWLGKKGLLACGFGLFHSRSDIHTLMIMV